MEQIQTQRPFPFSGVSICFAALMLYEAEQLPHSKPELFYFFAVLAFFSGLTAFAVRFLSARDSAPAMRWHFLSMGIVLILPFTGTVLPGCPVSFAGFTFDLARALLIALFCFGTGLLLRQERQPILQMGTGLMIVCLFLLVHLSRAYFDFSPVLLLPVVLFHIAACIAVRYQPYCRWDISMFPVTAAALGFSILIWLAGICPALFPEHPERLREEYCGDRLSLFRGSQEVDRIYLDPEGLGIHPGDRLPVLAILLQQKNLKNYVLITSSRGYFLPAGKQIFADPVSLQPEPLLAGLDSGIDLLILAMPQPLNENDRCLYARSYLERLAKHLAPEGVMAIRIPCTMDKAEIGMPENGVTKEIRGLHTGWLVYRPAGNKIETDGAVLAQHPGVPPDLAEPLRLVFPVLQIQNPCIPENNNPGEKITDGTCHAVSLSKKYFLTAAAVLLGLYLLARYFINTAPLHKPSFRALELGILAGLGTLGSAVAAIASGYGSFPRLFLYACISFSCIVLFSKRSRARILLMTLLSFCLYRFLFHCGWLLLCLAVLCPILFTVQFRRQPELDADKRSILTGLFLAGFAGTALTAALLQYCNIN